MSQSMTTPFSKRFIPPSLLSCLLFFWIGMLLFGIYFWEYKESGSLVSFFDYVSFMFLMIIITYREIQRGKKRIHDKNLLSAQTSSLQLQAEIDRLLLISDKKFLKISNFTFYAMLIILNSLMSLHIGSVIIGKIESGSLIFLAHILYFSYYIFKDIKLTKQRMQERIL